MRVYTLLKPGVRVTKQEQQFSSGMNPQTSALWAIFLPRLFSPFHLTWLNDRHGDRVQQEDPETGKSLCSHSHEVRELSSELGSFLMSLLLSE